MKIRSKILVALIGLIATGPLQLFNQNLSGNPVTIRMNNTGFGDNYYGTWKNIESIGCYNNDMHSSSKPGSYVEYYFTGTTIRWIGSKNKDHGFADVYIDDVLDQENIDTYADSSINQQILYSRTDLKPRQHKIKVVVKSVKNSLSDNYFQDIDAFEYVNDTYMIDPPPAPLKTPSGITTHSKANDNNITIRYSAGFDTITTHIVTGCYNNDVHASSTKGDYAEFTFTGTGIKWIGSKNDDYGFAEVYIDDKKQGKRIDNYSASPLRQQVLFFKTGLLNKEHKIKIVVCNKKNSASAGYRQDVDAFEYTTNNVDLPDYVPFYGVYEKNFIGNGIAGAGGNVEGTWDFLFGPDYSSTDMLNFETISLIIDGVAQSLNIKMYRGNKTGLYYGAQKSGDLNIFLIDITNDNSSWVSRIIRIDNTSVEKSHTIQVKSTISPQDGISSSIINGEALSITARSTGNWSRRTADITFSEPCTTRLVGQNYEISTNQITISPATSYNTGIYHYLHVEENLAPKYYVSHIRSRQPLVDLKTCIDEWNSWIEAGHMYEKQIVDQKAHNVIEDILVLVRMQQNRDGGFIATARKYHFAYIRDSHGAARMLLMTGHTEEVKRLIQNINRKWKIAGYIPNYWSMGSDKFIGHSDNDSSEITALYTFMIRDYYNKTKDIVFVDSVYNSLKWAVDAQVDYMSKNGWKIDFNGDETERYCVSIDGMEYGAGWEGLKNWDQKNWSMSSSAEAVASIQYFIDYLILKGNTELAASYSTNLSIIKNAIDSTYWRTDLVPNMHDWSKKRKDSTWYPYRVSNFSMIPLWVGAQLNSNRQNDDALAIKSFVNNASGYLALAPGSTPGMCGHTLPLMLYCLKKLDDPKASDIYNTIMNKRYLSCWGTVSEYYGPYGTANGHNNRVFESGILGEAIIRYFIGF